jgi:beta-glucosidase
MLREIKVRSDKMDNKPIYLNEDIDFETRAKDLVALMTLFEKTTQMTYNASAINRLGIPAYNWWNEALHGVARAGLATMFPQAIGMAASFDYELIKETASIISTEGRVKYHEAQRHNDR